MRSTRSPRWHPGLRESEKVRIKTAHEQQNPTTGPRQALTVGMEDGTDDPQEHAHQT